MLQQALKSSEGPPKILLDTSFILGISVTGATPEAFKILAETRTEKYYSRFSILESPWVATRTQDRTFDAEAFQLGLRSILEGRRHTEVEKDSEIFKEAFRLYRLGPGT